MNSVVANKSADTQNRIFDLNLKSALEDVVMNTMSGFIAMAR